MKKILFFSLLAGMALAGCTNDELVNDNAFGGNNEYIRFTYHSDNMTRAEKLQNTHYEFGVYAANGGAVMDNYLVAHGENELYNDFIGGATTYGDPTSQVDGLSYWFYESLGKTDGTYNKTAYNTPDNDQDLKYWDKSKASYTFWAYTPYTSNQTEATAPSHNALKATKDGDTFYFTGLSTFYTQPVEQIATADTRATGESLGYDAEMINYNEALWAKRVWEKGNYGQDVPFEFKHINAKVNLKFYSDVKGYNVKIIDAVPSDLGSGTVTPVAAAGVQLSPSTTLQSWTKMTTPQPTVLPTYYSVASGVQVNTSAANAQAAVVNVGLGVATVSENLKFKQPSGNIGTTSASATVSPTTLYVLPNCSGSSYITYARTSGEAWMDGDCTVGGVSKFNNGTSQHVADSTGYTLHLSYELIPTDGSTSMKIYDARVFVPASACKWEAGKAYTYVFKITKNSNGTTDPTNEIDPATESGDKEPYVDVTDPRVGNEPGLQPIVFDGVTVTDYVDGTTTEYPITEMTLGQSLEEALKNIKEIFSKPTQTGTTIYDAMIAEGSAGTVSDPYVITLNTNTSDFIDYTDTDVNNNNVYKDLQALFQSLYNEDGIKQLVYGGKEYTRSGSGSATPGLTPAVCWVNDGKSIESVIARELFTKAETDPTGTWIYNTTTSTTAGAVTVVSNKPIEPALYFTLTANNTADETLAETGLKKAATQFVATSNYGKKGTLSLVENSDKNYTLTLKANDEDLMWPGYPTTDASTNTNDNKVYNDVLTFMNQIIPTPFTSGEFGTTTSTTLADNVHLAAAVATVGFSVAVSDFTNKPFEFNTNSNLEIGDLTLDGGVTVKLVLFLNK